MAQAMGLPGPAAEEESANGPAGIAPIAGAPSRTPGTAAVAPEPMDPAFAKAVVAVMVAALGARAVLPVGAGLEAPRTHRAGRSAEEPGTAKAAGAPAAQSAKSTSTAETARAFGAAKTATAEPRERTTPAAKTAKTVSAESAKTSAGRTTAEVGTSAKVGSAAEVPSTAAAAAVLGKDHRGRH